MVKWPWKIPTTVEEDKLGKTFVVVGTIPTTWWKKMNQEDYVLQEDEQLQRGWNHSNRMLVVLE